MTTQRSAGRRRIGLTLVGILLVVLTLAIGLGAYTNYRIDRFSRSAFRDDATPPQTQYDAPSPVARTAPTPAAFPPTATAIVAPALASPVIGITQVVLPTAAAATSVQQPPPTETVVPTPTPLPYGNSPVIRRLRAGERVNVLLLGFGGPGHDGGYLTDSLQVMSFDPQGGVATLISLPRDLWVSIPPHEGRGGYWGRINEAYSVGMGQVDRNDTRVPYQKHDAGGQLAAKVAAQVLGLPIDYWVSLDFVGFRRFIDALGGVEVNVERAFVDTRYPANDDAAVDPSYKTVRFEAGRQRMNGQQAIEFARSRYAPEDGSDFGRARRQQLLMTAVKDQIFRVETIPKAFSLLDAVEGHFYTSFSFAEARDLAGWAQEQARDKRPIMIRGIVLETGNLLVESTSQGGAYILLPRGGQGEYGAIQRYVRDTFAGVTGTPGAGGTPRSSATPATPAFVLPSPTVTPRPRGGN